MPALSSGTKLKVTEENFFIYFVSQASNKHKSACAFGGVAMREQSQTQSAFCLERDSDDVGPPCSIPQP